MSISYLPTFIPTKILIIGCGGTGSRLVPLLAQFVKACPWVIDPEMTLIDDDIVEDKNLLRQNFISTDVGKYKAEVLAQRYSRAFNMKITASKNRVVAAPYRGGARGLSIPGYILPTEEQIQIFAKHSRNSIIVLCVDSPEARKDIITNMSYQNPTSTVLVLDSGNENDFGQVSISTWAQLKNLNSESKRCLTTWPNSIPGTMNIAAIPADLSYFYDMVAENTLSCADLDQTMAINTMMANAMFGIIQNFFYSKPITYHRLDVTLSNGVTPQYMSPRWLLKIQKFEERTTNLDKSLPALTYSGINNSLIDKWSNEGSLAAYPCQTVLELDNEIYTFQKSQWLPFKKLNDQAEIEAKAKEALAENKRISDLTKKIEAQVTARLKEEAAYEAHAGAAGTTDAALKIPKTKVASKLPAGSEPTAWPFTNQSEEVKMSPEAIKAIKAGLKEQEKLRETRFQARLQEVTQRESTRGPGQRVARQSTVQPANIDEWVNMEE